MPVSYPSNYKGNQQIIRQLTLIPAGYPSNYNAYQQNFYNSVNQGLQKLIGSQAGRGSNKINLRPLLAFKDDKYESLIVVLFVLIANIKAQMPQPEIRMSI